MSLRHRLASLIAGKAATEMPIAAIVSAGQPVWSEWSFEQYAKEAYAGNPFVYRAALTIMQAAGGVAVYPKLEQGEDYLDVDPGDPLARLMRQPAPWLSLPEWIEWMVGYYLLGGQAFAVGVGPDTGDNAGKPLRLVPVRPDHMHPVPARDERGDPVLGEVLRFEYTPRGAPRLYEPEDVFWFKAFNPLNAFDGQPAFGAAGKSIDTQNEALSYNYKTLHNGGWPTSIVVFEQGTNKEQAEAALDGIRRRLGEGNPGPVAAGAGGIKDIRQGFSPKDGNLSQTMQDCALAISLATGVPPELLGVSAHKTFSNYREARKALYTEAVLPLLDRFLGSLSGYLRQAFKDERVTLQYDRDDIEALQDDRSEKIDKLNGTVFMTINEKRAEMGFGPVPGGDVILVPSSSLPLEAVTGMPDVGAQDSGSGSTDENQNTDENQDEEQ